MYFNDVKDLDTSLNNIRIAESKTYPEISWDKECNKNKFADFGPKYLSTLAVNVLPPETKAYLSSVPSPSFPL